MDLNKKKALVKWIDALSDKTVNSFQDLQDGCIITSVLLFHGENCVQSENGLDTPQIRMLAIKKYVEAFYNQPIDEKNVINFDALLADHASQAVFEMEMGKLLLALLGCVVQDKCREKFIQPALNMEECYQYELKEMIEAVLFTDETGTQVATDFYEVLKRKTDSSAHLDAAFFFKLVADGTASPRTNHGTPSGNIKHPSRSDAPVCGMYTNSPQPGNTSGFNMRDISSPLRTMCLSSPKTPLGALMHSPQFAQKAMLRQKIQECKRMELALQNEQHLRSELELDLQERSALLEEKDAKLRDVDRQLSEVRWMRDQLDELELLRAEKENLTSENSKLQGRVAKYQDLKDHSMVLERENKEIQAEVQKAREEMKLMEEVQKSCEKYRVRCHKHQLEIAEQEALLQHRLLEIEQITQSLEESRNMYQVSASQFNSLKKEKEELEEMMGSAHGAMGVGLEGAVYAGESMGIVTDKKLSELQIQYDHIKETWIDPARYQTVLKDLEMEKETKAAYEKNYVEMKQKIMSSEDEVDLLKNKAHQLTSSLSELENSLQASMGKESELLTQLSKLESRNDGLKKCEDELRIQKEQLEDRLQATEKELSATQTELELTKTEIEVHFNASESRRITIMQLDTEKLEKHQIEKRLSNEVQSWKVKADELKDQLKTQKEESQKCEESLKEKLKSLQRDLDKIQTELKNEKLENDIAEKTMTEKIKSLESCNTELTEVLNTEKNILNKRIFGLESQVSAEQSSKEEQIESLKSLSKEYEAYQSSTKENGEAVSADLQALQKHKQDVDLELHRLKCEIKSLSQSYEEKLKHIETKHKDKEHSLKAEVEGFKTKHEDSLKVLKTLKEELSESKLLIQKRKLEEKKLNNIIHGYKTDNSHLGESIEKSKMTLIEYEYELKTCKDKMANDREQFATLQQEKDLLINNVHFQYESTVEQYKTDRSHLMDQISSLEGVLECEKRRFSEMEMNLKKSFNEVEAKLLSQIKLLEHEKKELMSSNESNVNDLKSTSEGISKLLKDKLSVLQKKVEEVESERFELECACKEQSKRIETMAEQLHNSEIKYKEACVMYEEINESNKKTISKLEASLKKSTDTNESLKKAHVGELQRMELAKLEQRKENENCILCYEETIKELENNLSKTKEELMKANNEIEMKLQLTLCESEKLMRKSEMLESESRSEKETLKSEVEKYKSFLKESEAKISQLNKKIEDLESKLKKVCQSRADLECQLLESKQETHNIQSELEEKLYTISMEKTQAENLFEENKVKMERERIEMRDKLTETESYWQSQCEQLEEEYSRGAQEQKEEVRVQLEEMECNYESQLQNLSDEKDANLAAQIQEFKDIITSLEKEVSVCKAEIQSVCCEKVSQATDYERRMNDLSAVVVKYQADCSALSGESEILKAQCKLLEEEKVERIEMLIGEYETQIAELKTSLTLSQEQVIPKLKEEHTEKVSKLEADLNDQRVSYQKMISEMQEKLGEETFDLRERFSQMKCQYEKLIESKEKDTKQKVTELENEIKLLENNYMTLQQTISCEKLDNAHKQNDLSKVINNNNKLESIIEKAKLEQMEVNKQLASSMSSVNELESELKSVQNELAATEESVIKEKGEKEESERQLEYIRDRNDTLTAELSSQQQQLAAVEEEKRIVEVETAKNKTMVEELKQQHKKDLSFREIEKHELERQLQSSQKCYEAVQKAQMELESQIARMGQDRLQLENRNRELEQRIYNYLEREKKLTEDNSHQINTASEINAKLRNQLDVKSNEMRDLNDKFNKEMEMTTVQFNKVKFNFEKDLNTITEQKNALETEVASLLPMVQKLNEAELERKRLQDINDKYNIHYNKKKEVITKLTEELKAKHQELENLKVTEDKLVKEVTPLREKLEVEAIKNKSLGAKMRTLEAQNDLADRKIKELQARLDDKEQAIFGDSTHFMKMLKVRENSTDASFMENHPGTIPMNESIFESAHSSFSDSTLTSEQRESRGRKRISKSVSSALINKEYYHGMNADTVSIGSASSLAHRLRSRDSITSLNKSIASFDSFKSNSSVPRGTGKAFHCEDEPMELEWGRLGELQRRNTLCPAHLKTSYPVETQTYKPNKFKEDALRESTMGNSTILNADTGSGRKRKKMVDTDSSGAESSDSTKSKLAKTGCVYQKPGPPTPANSRRSSKGSRSPSGRLSSGKLSKSPKTPVHAQGKRTSKRTPRNTPKRSAMEVDGSSSAKKLGKRDSVSFSVGFSPVSMHKSSRLTRQQAFIQKQPQSSGQMLPPKRKPLGIRNFLQTGL